MADENDSYNELELWYENNRDVEYYVYEPTNREATPNDDDDDRYEEIREPTTCYDEEIERTQLMRNVFDRALTLINDPWVKFNVYKMFLFYLRRDHGACSAIVREQFEMAIKELKSSPDLVRHLCQQYAQMEAEDENFENARQILTFCSESRCDGKDVEFWMNWYNFELTYGTDESRKSLKETKLKSFNDGQESSSITILLPLDKAAAAEEEEAVKIAAEEEATKKSVAEKSTDEEAAKASVVEEASPISSTAMELSEPQRQETITAEKKSDIDVETNSLDRSIVIYLSPTAATPTTTNDWKMNSNLGIRQSVVSNSLPNSARRDIDDQLVKSNFAFDATASIERLINSNLCWRNGTAGNDNFGKGSDSPSASSLPFDYTRHSIKPTTFTFNLSFVDESSDTLLNDRPFTDRGIKLSRTISN